MSASVAPQKTPASAEAASSDEEEVALKRFENPLFGAKAKEVSDDVNLGTPEAARGHAAINAIADDSDDTDMTLSVCKEPNASSYTPRTHSPYSKSACKQAYFLCICEKTH